MAVGTRDNCPAHSERADYDIMRPMFNASVVLIPGLGHVPHMEAPEKTYPPLIAFLKEGLAAKQ